LIACLMSREQFTQLVAQLSSRSDVSFLGSVVAGLGQKAWAAQDVVFPRTGSKTLSSAALPSANAAGTVEPDVLGILRRGIGSSDELDVLAALTLLGISAAWPSSAAELSNLSRCLLWLETYSGLRCLSSSGAVLDVARQRQLAEAVLGLLTEGSPAEQQIGRAWLLSDASLACAELAQRAAVAPTSSRTGDNQPLEGKMGPRPRHPLTLAVLALTGLLFVARGLRCLGSLVLRSRVPTSVWLSARGLEMFSRHELLGHVLKERRVIVPLEDIRTVEREIRFPRFGLYAGLLALACGTILGTRLVIDGLRVAGLSFPLVATGLSLILVGILLDMLLSGLGDARRSRCRLVILTRRGRGWAVGDLEPSRVDQLLTELSERLAAGHRS
jgi:hypothetical protein